MYNKMNNTNKILKEIFQNPTYSFHIRELARITRLNPNTIINISKNLEKDKIITKNKTKNIVEIKANIEDQTFIRKKRTFNLNELYDSGLIDFLIEKYDNPELIAILGSFSRGEDIEKSDIDIIVITDKKDIPYLEKFEKKLKRKIHLIPSTYKEISKEFYNNLINGIVLHGYIR